MARKKRQIVTAGKYNVVDLCSLIQGRFGQGSIMTMNNTPNIKVSSFTTGSLKIDKATGVGGFPRGRITEIYGPESSGKTTAILHAIAEAQSQGELAAFIDLENALDVEYARNIGVDVDNLLISQPDCAEDAIGIVEALIDTGSVAIIGVDSIAAMVPRAELEGTSGDAMMGLQARLMGQMCRKTAKSIRKFNVAVIFTNQIRHKIGVVFGSPETTPGGNAMKFYAGIRIEIRKSTIYKGKDGEVISNDVKVKIVKNKLSAPFKQAVTNVKYGFGFNKWAELLETGIENGVIEKRGAWISMNGEQLGQGKEQAELALREYDYKEMVKFITEPAEEVDEEEEAIEVTTTEVDNSDEIKKCKKMIKKYSGTDEKKVKKYTKRLEELNG